MLPLLQVLAVVLAGWLNRHPQRVLEYLQEENRILKRRLRGRRLRLTDTDRVRLAVRGMALGRRVLDQFASIVTPETIPRWHRSLIANKWTSPCRQPDRKLVMQRITELVVRMARENLGDSDARSLLLDLWLARRDGDDVRAPEIAGQIRTMLAADPYAKAALRAHLAVERAALELPDAPREAVAAARAWAEAGQAIAAPR